MEKQTEEKSKKKDFMFRGKTLNELSSMDIREFARLLKSNEKRTLLRQYNEVQKFILRCDKNNKNKKTIRTHLRHLVIVPQIIGMKMHVYNGKEFLPIIIDKEMLGHRLGEFSVTRQKVKHGAAGIGATKSSASQSVK